MLLGGKLIKNLSQASLSEWRLVFWIAFGVLVVTSVIYGFWASGEIQDFNEPKDLKEIEAEGGIGNTTETPKPKKSCCGLF